MTGGHSWVGKFKDFTQEDQPGIQGLPISFSLSYFSFFCHSLFPFAPFSIISSPLPINWAIDIYLFPLSVPPNSSVCSLLFFQSKEVRLIAPKSLLRFILYTFPALSLCFTCLVECVSYFSQAPFSESLGQHGRPYYFTSQPYSATTL
jgi:hypothetical protein